VEALVIKLQTALKLARLLAITAGWRATFLVIAAWKQRPSLATNAVRRATFLVIAPMLALVVEDTAAAAVADFLPLRARSVTVAAKLATLHVPAPKLLATLATVEVEVEAMARSAAVAEAEARLATHAVV